MPEKSIIKAFSLYEHSAGSFKKGINAYSAGLLFSAFVLSLFCGYFPYTCKTGKIHL
jgi:hypothetical protein